MRSRFMVLLAAATVAATAHAQSETAITRQDGYWLQTVTADFPISGVLRCRVITRGPVTVNGGSGDRLRYVLRKRIRAASEGEARRVFDMIEARLSREREVAHLQLTMPRRNMPLPELEVFCPRNLRYCLVSTDGGGVQVAGIGGDAEIITSGGRIQADRIGGSLIGRTGGGDIRIGTVGGLLRCYTGGGPVYVKRAGGEAWLDTGGGEILVEDAGGAVHASTGAGNVEVLRAMSSVSARTSGGLIRVMEAAGLVTAESAGGGIQVGSARGVRLESVGGGIKLHKVTGELRVATAVGSILAELLSGGAIEDSFLSTGSGDVTVFIPSNLAVTVEAQNDSPGRLGRIVSDFPEIRVRNGAAAPRGRVVATGAINGGGPQLVIAAANGTIFLRRQE